MVMSSETIESLMVGASGGIPLTAFLLWSMKSLRDSFEGIKDNFEKISRRLEKLELSFEVNYQRDVKHLTEATRSLEARLLKLEENYLRRLSG
jgi:hypothetical protein